MSFLTSPIRFLLHKLGFDLTRWPASTERFEAQVIACLRAFPVHGLIDVGARNGSFSSSICSELNLQHLIFVDPDLSGLQVNFFKNNVRKVDLLEAAAFSRKDTLTLYTYVSPDFTSLLPPTPFGASQFPQSLEVVSESRLNVDTLDNLVFSRLIPEMRYALKVDVQGVDLQVLLGSSLVISAVDIICLEVSFQPIYQEQSLYDEIFAFMKSHSFKLSSLTPVTRDSSRGLIEANVVFVRES